MKCIICGGDSEKVFLEKVLQKYDVSYYLCKECGFHHSETPYWLEESYTKVINIHDFGIMDRNLQNRKRIVSYLWRNREFSKKNFYRKTYYAHENCSLIDYGGGHGILTRLLRDAGISAWWSDKYAVNDFAVGFEASEKQYKYMTMFEVMEHIADPVSEIAMAVQKYNPETIFFSTLLYGDKGVLPDRNWWYYVFDMGQHISFYTKETLEIIADKLGYKFYTNGINYHCFSKNTSFSRIMRLKDRKIGRIFDRKAHRIKSFLSSDGDYLLHYVKTHLKK